MQRQVNCKYCDVRLGSRFALDSHLRSDQACEELREVELTYPVKKRCEPVPSGIAPPKVVPHREDNEQISLRQAQALVAHMTFYRQEAVSLARVTRSSASIAGWSRFYLAHFKPNETWVIGSPRRIEAEQGFVTPLSSPTADSLN